MAFWRNHSVVSRLLCSQQQPPATFSIIGATPLQVPNSSRGSSFSRSLGGLVAVGLFALNTFERPPLLLVSSPSATMDPAVKVELAVEMTCENCVTKVNGALQAAGLTSFTVNLEGQRVIVDTTLSPIHVLETLEATGLSSKIVGLGSSRGENLGAAVSIVTGPNSVVGVVRFVQLSAEAVMVDGVIDGLSPGLHGLHIHEYGDLSNGCASTGGHYNPHQRRHGGPDDEERHAGDLGNMVADQNGRGRLRRIDRGFAVRDIIGCAVVVAAGEDDLGRGGTEASLKDGGCGEGLACGIVARAAGVQENVKRVCTCSGKVLWEEKMEVDGPSKK